MINPCFHCSCLGSFETFMTSFPPSVPYYYGNRSQRIVHMHDLGTNLPSRPGLRPLLEILIRQEVIIIIIVIIIIPSSHFFSISSPYTNACTAIARYCCTLGSSPLAGAEGAIESSPSPSPWPSRRSEWTVESQPCSLSPCCSCTGCSTL